MSEHDDLVRQVCETHGASTHDFHNSVVAAFPEDGEATALEMIRAHGIRPDAFRVSTREVEGDQLPALDVWEVVVHHPISDDKLERYKSLFAWLDDHNWYFNLHKVDRHGASVTLMGDDHPSPLLEQWI